MARLRERNRQIPGGLRYKCSPLKYQSSNWHSFDKIVADVWARIRSNPYLAAKHNLPNTRSGVEDMVDAYNAMVCEQNGWLDFITSGGEEAAPVPKWFSPQMSSRLGGKLVAGAKALLQWLGEGGEPVPAGLAEARAAVCAKCPLNRKMELKDFFVHGASELIRRQIEFANECGLSTIVDTDLGICTACGCPLKLAVHVPIMYKVGQLTADVRSSLDCNCWVLSEEKSALEPQTLTT